MMLSTKNLVFKERLVKKLTEKYIGLYVVKNVMSSIKEYSKVKAACQDRWRWTLFYFSFFILFYFSFLFFLFLFLEQLGLGLIGHTVTSVTSWWQSHKTNHETWENLVEDSRTNDVIQHGHHMLTSWTTHGCLG